MSASIPPSLLPIPPVDKPPSPQQASRRFLTTAFVVSLVAHVIFFAVGSQFPAMPPTPPDRLIEVTFIPAAPKKLALAVVPHPPAPRRPAPPKPRRVGPPLPHLAIKPASVTKPRQRTVPQPVPKPLPAKKLVTPPKTRIAKALVPDKPVAPTKSQPARQPKNLVDNHPQPKAANHSASAPAAPGLHAKSPRRYARRMPDEQNYASHPLKRNATNLTLPPTNAGRRSHESADVADGSDAASGSTSRSTTHSRYSGVTGGSHSDTSSFLPDGDQNPPATDNGAPPGTSSAAPGGGASESSNTRANDSPSDNTDDSGFNHGSGLPSSHSNGDNSGSTHSSSRTRGSGDAAGVSEGDDSQLSGRSRRGGSRQHQRLADNPFGDLPPVDKPPPEPRPTPTQRPIKRLPDREAHHLGDSRPEYPEEAKQLNAHGTVLLSVSVSAQGDAESVRIKQSSGYDILDQAAQRWASGLRYRPARRGGKDVASIINIPADFHMRN